MILWRARIRSDEASGGKCRLSWGQMWGVKSVCCSRRETTVTSPSCPQRLARIWHDRLGVTDSVKIAVVRRRALGEGLNENGTTMHSPTSYRYEDRSADLRITPARRDHGMRRSGCRPRDACCCFVACGAGQPVPDGYTGRFRVAGTVLENQQHGPQLCILMAAADSGTASVPPPCGGIALSGWTWKGLDPESSSGTTWGFYVVTGTFNGHVFKLTEPATVNRRNVQPSLPDFTSPCAVPAGGWRPVNLAKATDRALRAASIMVSADPNFGGLWIDQKIPPADPNHSRVVMTDPTKLLLDVRFTEDLARHDADIRKVWGGALCVSLAKHPYAELVEVQNQLSGDGVLNSSTNAVTGTIDAEVLVATQERQRGLDAKYGSGLVHLIGALDPID